MIEMYCQNNETGEIFDIITLVSNIQYTTSLGDQPGKLTFLIEQDPNNILNISIGSVISLIVDKQGIFFGYTFIMGTDATDVYRITAYDQSRYLKNEDTMLIKNMTANQVFSKICSDYSLKGSVSMSSNFIIPSYFYEKRTLYSIIQQSIVQANINDQKQYVIYDKFGTLIFDELQNLKTNLIIGDKSLLNSYQYEISIDSDTYNTIKVTKDNEETGKRDVWIEFDSNNQQKWGTLQLLVQADKNDNEAQIRELASNLLKLKNNETRTMKLSALGNINIQAGSGFMLQIDKLNMKQYMWVTNSVHNIEKNFHTMQLEVFI